MKRFKLLAFILLLTVSNLFAQEVHNDQLLEIGRYRNKLIVEDDITILDNNVMIYTKTRQVGYENDVFVPFPTVCSYIETSKIFKKVRAKLWLRPIAIQLISGDKHCNNFIIEMTRIVNEGDSFSFKHTTDLVRVEEQ